MNRLPMSRPAAALLRALLQRAGEGSETILLSNVHSVEWHSLTFSGERHRFDFRLVGANRQDLARRLTHRLDDFEFQIPGQIVADIAVAASDGDAGPDAITLSIEALTIED